MRFKATSRQRSGRCSRSWSSDSPGSRRQHLSLVDRIDKIGQALLSLKEIEYLGEPRSGNLYERAEKLVEELLDKLEADWKINDTSGSVIARVKRLRTAILPDMVAGKVTPEERARRWRDLAAATTRSRCRTIRAITSCAKRICRSASSKRSSGSRRISPTTCACTSRFMRDPGRRGNPCRHAARRATSWATR